MTGKTQAKRLLVLGASGKLGRIFRWAAPQAASYPVDLSVVFRGDDHPDGALVWSEGVDPSAWGPVDAIVALWGVTRGSPEDLGKNTTLALEAIRLGDILGVDRVLHCSSVAVYAPLQTPLPESALCAPMDAYGQAKLAMEKAVQDAPSQARQVMMRIGSIAGAESLFANGLKTGAVELPVFEDGLGPQRSYISPMDITRAICDLCAIPVADLPFAVNLGAQHPVGMADLALAMGWTVHRRAMQDGERQRAILQTNLLHSLVSLPPEASDPVHIAQSVLDWRRSG